MNDTPSVVYVEDDPQSRTIMRMLFKSRMKLEHVTILEDSQDFVEKVSAIEPKPDIFFLDIHVAPLNGFDMIKSLRQLDWVNGTPIVALTASVMNEEVQQLRQAGFAGCLSKPVDMGTFPEVFNRLLGGEILWRITD